ncbi:Oxidoreductase [Pleurostoma richardsiae]|uniref:Oxidoreductase n=1 Tax=Pleurostoma richardsiae TaxID=41990 RepID=A0AA38VMD0_9PEZI|nr:Oxidoreductase [Pleurostoma richardsiae]
MTTFYEHTQQWHPGELAVHQLLGSPHRQGSNPTSRGLPAPYGYRVAASPLVAFGALDSSGRPWTTLWGGERGFARPVAQGVLGVQGLVDSAHDPVVQALFEGVEDGEMVQGGKEGGRVMAALSIDLSTRDRVKLAGRMLAGAVVPRDQGSSNSPRADGGENKDERGGVAEVQLAMLVEESLGNCPKYLNSRTIRAHLPSPSLVSDTLPLPAAALALLARADLFFLSSTDGRTMDTNHRGGPPGFVRVERNDESSSPGGTVLVYPEYSGNRLYQTLGNLHQRPQVGLCVPDLATGEVLYLTGTARILAGAEAAGALPHSKVAVRITVAAARLVRDGLPFRAAEGPVGYSPYNPPVRRLAGEQGAGEAVAEPGAATTAALVGREVLTPSVARFTFRVSPPPPPEGRVLPGGHVTLDFSEELDEGWSHMRDGDPGSLNDDFVRTFTVSNDMGSSADAKKGYSEMQITARRHGPATALLWRWNLRVPLEVKVVGFGGDERFRIAGDAVSAAGEGEKGRCKKTVFVAGGVGITPLLAQAPGLLSPPEGQGKGGEWEVIWSLRAEDLGLAVDSLERMPGLGERVRLFITGDSGEGQEQQEEERVQRVEKTGAVVVRRRLEEGDLKAGQGSKYHLCAPPGLLKALVGWLGGEDVVWESFEY